MPSDSASEGDLGTWVLEASPLVEKASSYRSLVGPGPRSLGSHPPPTQWGLAGPWHDLLIGGLFSAAFDEDDRRRATKLIQQSGRIQAEWDRLADQLRADLIEARSLPASAVNIERQTFIEDPLVEYAASQLDDVTHLATLVTLRDSKPTPRIRNGGPVDVVAELAVAGVIGNYAWFLLHRALREVSDLLKPYSGPVQRNLTNDDVKGYLALYLDGHVPEMGEELLLVSEQWDRSGFRETVGDRVRWTFVLVGRRMEYRIVLEARSGDAHPTLVTLETRASTEDRYKQLRSKGYCEPLPSWEGDSAR